MAGESATALTVTFTATSEGDYNGLTAEATYIIGYFGDAHASMVEVTPGEIGSGTATVTWTAPATRLTPTAYRVEITAGPSNPFPQAKTVTGLSATIVGIVSDSDPYTFTVVAIYGIADATDPAGSSAPTAMQVII